jgi:hypothetical protein
MNERETRSKDILKRIESLKSRLDNRFKLQQDNLSKSENILTQIRADLNLKLQELHRRLTLLEVARGIIISPPGGEKPFVDIGPFGDGGPFNDASIFDDTSPWGDGGTQPFYDAGPASGGPPSFSDTGTFVDGEPFDDSPPFGGTGEGADPIDKVINDIEKEFERFEKQLSSVLKQSMQMEKEVQRNIKNFIFRIDRLEKESLLREK